MKDFHNEFSYTDSQATGFTGIRVAERISKEIEEKNLKLTWAIAGRDIIKLKDLESRIEQRGGSHPNALIRADIRDSNSLMECAKQGKVLMNCTGPYRFLGEPVVKACLDVGTDYIDLCGEPEFMDRMFLKYHTTAKEKNILIIHACAFDSVPADLGCIFAQQQYKYPAVCTHVESFLSIHTGTAGGKGHATTFEAAVHGFGSARELQSVRKQLKEKHPLQVNNLGERLIAKTGPYFESRIHKYCFRFPGSDASVVKSSQRSLAMSSNSKNVFPHYAAYFAVTSIWWAFVTATIGGIFQFLATKTWGRKLLLKSPGFWSAGAFSHDGPTEEQMETTSFSMKFFSLGYSNVHHVQSEEDFAPLHNKQQPDKKVVTLVTGPEPGYVATPLIFVALARCLLDERPNLPNGGVFTPGAVFANSSLIDRLNRDGLTFSVVEP